MSLPPIGLGPRTSEYTIRDEMASWPPAEQMAVVTEDYKATAVVGLVKLARSKGWRVVVTEAKGSWPTVGQKPSRQRLSLAVRMHAKAGFAVAVYVEPATEGGTWAWDAMYVNGRKAATITAFKALL